RNFYLAFPSAQFGILTSRFTLSSSKRGGVSSTPSKKLLSISGRLALRISQLISWVVEEKLSSSLSSIQAWNAGDEVLFHGLESTIGSGQNLSQLMDRQKAMKQWAYTS